MSKPKSLEPYLIPFLLLTHYIPSFCKSCCLCHQIYSECDHFPSPLLFPSSSEVLWSLVWIIAITFNWYNISKLVEHLMAAWEKTMYFYLFMNKKLNKIYIAVFLSFCMVWGWGEADYGQAAKFLLHTFINKVLLENYHDHSLAYCIWLLILQRQGWVV